MRNTEAESETRRHHPLDQTETHTIYIAVVNETPRHQPHHPAPDQEIPNSPIKRYGAPVEQRRANPACCFSLFRPCSDPRIRRVKIKRYSNGYR